MKKTFKNALNCFVVIAFLTACGGRTPAPVMISQYGDQNKSCKALEFEMQNIQGEIQRLLPNTDKTGKNVALGVAGWFLLVPWFFMDFKNAEQTEYEAYRQRYNHLGVIAMDKECGIEKEEYPSVEEMKAAYEAAKAKEEAESKKPKTTTNINKPKKEAVDSEE